MNQEIDNSSVLVDDGNMERGVRFTILEGEKTVSNQR